MLRIMTLNINGYGDKHGPWETRRALIAAAIAAADADVVAMQAVARNPARAKGEDQASQLRAMLPGYRYHLFEPASAQADGETGNAFLARIPLSDKQVHRLSCIEGHEDTQARLLLAAYVDSREGHLCLVNGHFSWVPTQNARNVDETLAHLDAVRTPTLLMGDLNATPDSEALRPLPRRGWVDAWARLRPRDPGFTFEPPRPESRIDYVWAQDETRHRIGDIALVGAPAPGAVRLSDHLGLVVTIS